MFYRNKFKALSNEISDIYLRVTSIEHTSATNTAKRISELKKELAKRLDADGKEDLAWRLEQNKITEKIIDKINKLIDENELLKKQVAALIETHPNRDMYFGVFNKPETVKK